MPMNPNDLRKLGEVAPQVAVVPLALRTEAYWRDQLTNHSFPNPANNTLHHVFIPPN